MTMNISSISSPLEGLSMNCFPSLTLADFLFLYKKYKSFYKNVVTHFLHSTNVTFEVWVTQV